MGYFIVGLFIFIALWIVYSIHNDSVCSYCGEKYEIGPNKWGRSNYINKHLSKDFIPNMSLGGGSDGGDQNCYCTECYIEIFGESPEDRNR